LDREKEMALDDPVVIMLIVGAAILLFGGAKIPEFARSLGKARREFTRAVNGLPEEIDSKK
jgi:TatA/E family protein of Tat protein translocase